MPIELSFGAAIMVGLLGSSHCIGMCGGIVGALNLSLANNLHARRKVLLPQQLGYHCGRIVSYMLVGLAAGSLGAGLQAIGLEPLIGKLLAAAFMIALGLYLANWWRGLAVLERVGFKLWRHIQPLGKRLFPVRNTAQAFLLGMLWGWLPCGLVYAVVVWALTTGNAYDAAMLMLGFGLGTLPAMLIVGQAFQHFKGWVKSPVMRGLAGATIIAFGVYGGYSSLVGDHLHRHANGTPAVQAQAALSLAPRTPAILRRVL